MPSLKDLKNRISSVKSTRKITSAMKMVAASKLRRAQEQAEQARPYATRMGLLLSSLAQSVEIGEGSPKLITGTGKEETVLLIVVTSDRGLCGAFNGSIVREARRQIAEMESKGQKVLLICVGRKGRDLLRREHGQKIVQTMENVAGKGGVPYAVAEQLGAKLIEMFEEGQFDVARLLFNSFKSAISQVVTLKRVIPVDIAPAPKNDNVAPAVTGPAALCEIYEPSKEALLTQLLPYNLSVQVFSALLESAAGEQGARMTSMDNATRNAGDMIDRLTLNYNRSRQAFITKELIEIISGAEAV